MRCLASPPKHEVVVANATTSHVTWRAVRLSYLPIGSKLMRIDYIGGAYIPSREANSMHVMRMCQAMARLGHDVTLHVRRGGPPVLDDYLHYGVERSFRIVKHERPQIRVYGALVNAGHVAAYFKAHKLPDLFYAREIYGLAFMARSGVPFVFESHWKPKHFVQAALESRLFRRANFRRVVFISEALERIYRELFPWLKPEQMVVAHDAADPVEMPSSSGSPHDRLQIGYVGGFLPGYGLELLLELARAVPDMDFHVVGGKEDAIAHWRRRAYPIGNLTFHGFVAPRELTERYAGFDVLLAPYQSTTAHIRWISPMKLFEYMAHGKPIICSDFPVLREILEHDVDALFVAPTVVAQWRSALERMRDPNLRQRLGAQAHRKLEAQFTWRHRAERVLSGLDGRQRASSTPG